MNFSQPVSTASKDKIKVGDQFLCIKDVWMNNDTTDIRYFEGKVYKSENDDCITDETGDKYHYWYLDETYGLPDFSQFFQIIDTVDKRQFESGAVRDTNKNKPFIHCLLGYTRQRFGYHMSKNAQKYGEKNFMKGIPTEVYLESIDRHMAAYMEGDRSEDHLSSILFGVNGLMLNEKNEGVKADHYFKL